MLAGSVRRVARGGGAGGRGHAGAAVPPDDFKGGGSAARGDQSHQGRIPNRRHPE